MQVINHELSSHQLLLENQPAAANPPQPVVEGSKPEPGAKEAAPQPAPPSEKTATAAVVPGPAPVTAQTSASASATAEMQRSAVDQSSAAPEKQKDEAAPSAATVNTAAPALKKEVAEQQQKQQESQQEPEAAQPAPAEPQQSAKEPGPKRKKAFSFFKREKCALCPAHVSMPPGSFTHCRDHCRYWPSGDCCNQVYIYMYVQDEFHAVFLTGKYCVAGRLSRRRRHCQQMQSGKLRTARLRQNLHSKKRSRTPSLLPHCGRELRKRCRRPRSRTPANLSNQQLVV